MSMKILPNIPVWLRSCIGTSIPHCSIYCKSPTVFKHTDLPPALGPEIIRMRWWVFSSMSSGTTFLLCLANEICNKGWIAVDQSNICRFSKFGLMALIWMAKCALARIKSISAKNSYECRIAGTCGRTVDENSVRIRIISRRSSPIRVCGCWLPLLRLVL